MLKTSPSSKPATRPVADDTVCRVCGEPVRWYVTAGGTVVDLNPTPDANGNHIIVAIDGRVRVQVLTGAEMPAQTTAFRRHVCPPKPARPGLRCVVCFLPMDLELARAERWNEHPSCDPTVLEWHARQKARTRRASRRRKDTTA